MVKTLTIEKYNFNHLNVYLNRIKIRTGQYQIIINVTCLKNLNNDMLDFISEIVYDSFISDLLMSIKYKKNNFKLCIIISKNIKHKINRLYLNDNRIINIKTKIKLF